MTRVFSFDDLSVLVEGAEDGHLVWLTEFLGPHFGADGARAHTVHVRLVEDQGRYEEALAAGSGEDTRDAFVFDTRIVTLPRWRGAQTRLFEAKWQLFYEVESPPLAVTIISAPGNRRVRSALVDVVREVTINHAQRKGDLLLHASAFAIGGHGVIVGGPKRAGKTTLLLHALSGRPVEYVSNDRVLVPPGATPRAHGVPTSVGLRRGTLDLFPALAERLSATGYDQHLSLTEAAARDPRTAVARSGGRRLTPTQLCRLLDVQPRADCEINMLVFPRITGEPGTFALRRLDPAETFVHLEGALFGIEQGRWTSDVFTIAGDPPSPDRAALEAGCRALVERVPGFECRLDLGAYTDASARDDLLGALLASARTPERFPR